MKNIFLIIFSFLSINSIATDWEYYKVPPLRHSLGISSTYFFESDAITNRFALAYFRNEFLDNKKKDAVSNELSKLNHFGAGFINEIKYSKYNDTIFNLAHSFYSISIRDIYHLNCKFSKDAFELFFRGNKAYAGKNALLSDFIFNQIIYRQVNFTFGHEYKFDKDKFGFQAGLSLNFGRQLYRITSPKATLYTDINGEYLDLNADISIHRSDSSNNELSSLNGFGFSGDFSFFWKNERNNKLSISVENFGYIRWNNQSSFTHTDTTFRFEGIDISDVFLLKDSIHKTISLDSSLVEPYLTDKEKKNFSYNLPAMFKLTYRYILKPEKLDLEGEISYFSNTESSPQESLSLGYSFLKNQRFALKGTYGGFTGFRMGINCEFLILKRWMLTLQSDQLSGMFKSDGNAQGAFLSLSAYF